MVGLDEAAFGDCLASDRYLDAIDQSAKDAGTVQITGTPTFVVGVAEGDVVEGKRVVGARDVKVFEQNIVSALDEQRTAAK
jgi:predicted DsbA family dithiol-disulfide isomerase